MECGNDPGEIEEALAGQHTYKEWRVSGKLPLTLCDFCIADFPSHDPLFYLGLPEGTELETVQWDFVRQVPPNIVKDWCCPQCGWRLAFLEFIVRARALNGGMEGIT